MGKTAGQLLPASSDALAYKSGCRIGNSVAGHITEALGRNGKGVSCNGKDTEWRYDDCRQNLGSANNYMFYPHRETDTECFPERVSFQSETDFPAAVTQFLRADQQIPEQHTCNNGLCGSRTQSGTAYTQSGARKGELYTCNAASARWKNQEEIEYYIQHAHDDAQQTGNVLGFAVNHYFRQTTQRIVPLLPMFSTLSIAFIIGIIVAHNSASILACSLIVAVAVILHNILGLALGYGLSALTGSESPKRSAIAIEVGMQNSGLATSLAATHFAMFPMAAVPGAMFSVWHNFSGSIAAQIFRRQSEQKNK